MKAGGGSHQKVRGQHPCQTLHEEKVQLRTYFPMHDLYEIFIETEIAPAQDITKCTN
jgi:hypothetical protein